MSRAGNEMVAELSKLLNKYDVSLEKTAAKKEDEKDEKKEDKKEKKEEKDEKEKKDKKKKDKKKKKAEVMMDVVNSLVKLAEDLDADGAKEAADLVDDALQVIIKNMKETE